MLTLELLCAACLLGRIRTATCSADLLHVRVQAGIRLSWETRASMCLAGRSSASACAQRLHGLPICSTQHVTCL